MKSNVLQAPILHESIVPPNSTNISEFECYLCNQTFTNKECLKNHIKIHPSDPLKLCNQKRIFQCYHCQKLFYDETDCRHHMTSLCFQSLVCRICDKVFLSRPKLQQHLSLHIGEKLCDTTTMAKDMPFKPKHKFPLVVHHTLTYLN